MDAAGILSVVSDHGFGDISTARKVAILNDVIWDICSLEPWPFLEKTVTLTFSGSSGIPSNYPTDVAQVFYMIDPINGPRLYPLRVEEFKDRFATIQTDHAAPYFYYFLKDVLSVYPVPAASQTLDMGYLFFPAAIDETAIESAIIVPPRFHSVIWFGMLAHLYDEEDEPDLASKFEGKYMNKIQKMRNQIWLRQVDRPDTIEVTDFEDIWT